LIKNASIASSSSQQAVVAVFSREENSIKSRQNEELQSIEPAITSSISELGRHPEHSTRERLKNNKVTDQYISPCEKP
jgi:hypothetical protein